MVHIVVGGSYWWLSFNDNLEMLSIISLKQEVERHVLLDLVNKQSEIQLLLSREEIACLGRHKELLVLAWIQHEATFWDKCYSHRMWKLHHALPNLALGKGKHCK